MVWPLMMTSDTGDAGRAVDAGVADAGVADAGVADVLPVDVDGVAGWTAGFGFVVGWGCCVVAVVLRLVVGRRLVWAIDVDEKISSAIAGNRMVVGDFIRKTIRA